jgi:hypothetical protein
MLKSNLQGSADQAIPQIYMEALVTRSRKRVLAGIVVASILVALTFLIRETFPSVVPHKTDHVRLNYLKIGMSESEVVELMGSPQRATKGKYLPSGAYWMGELHYTLDDGRSYVIVLDEHGKVAAAGEPETSHSITGNPNLDALKRMFSGN